MKQLTVEAAELCSLTERQGYAEFEHHIENSEVEGLVTAYADFTLAFPDPEPTTMDAMLPSKPSDTDLLNKDRYHSNGGFSYDLWLSRQLDVLDRSQDTQESWHKYRTNAPGVGKPNGYTNRSYQSLALKQTRGIEIVEDPKEYYHFSPVHVDDMQRLHNENGWGPIPPEALLVDQRFGVIHQRATELITRICAMIEEVHPDISQFITPKSLRTSPARLLFYHPGSPYELAEAHYDKGSLTLQLAESHQGLRVQNRKTKALDFVFRDSNYAAFFPAIGIRDNLDAGTPYQPSLHDVVGTGMLNPDRFIPTDAKQACARWALIFFAQGENQRYDVHHLTHMRYASK